MCPEFNFSLRLPEDREALCSLLGEVHTLILLGEVFPDRAQAHPFLATVYKNLEPHVIEALEHLHGRKVVDDVLLACAEFIESGERFIDREGPKFVEGLLHQSIDPNTPPPSGS